MTVCPIWKKSNELFEKIYSSRKPTSVQTLTLFRKKLSALEEAGLLYLGIRDGWANVSDEWRQSPALIILKQVDEFLFRHLPRTERLATAYKSFKLLKVRHHDRLECTDVDTDIHSITSIAAQSSCPKSQSGCAPA